MPNVTFETSHGNIVIELNEEKAPITVKNFLAYVNDGFFDGTIFHRVIPNFMIQGGGFLPDMTQKECSNPIENEADNGLANDLGTIAMARTSEPHSATAQFFINHKDNAFLNYTLSNDQGWGYCVFGKVSDGMDTVNSIAAVSTGNSAGHGDVPVETITIIKAIVS